MNVVGGTLLVILAVVVTLLVFVLLLLWYIFASTALMLMLRKAGHPRPWGAWIPVYRDWVVLDAGGQNGWWALLAAVPIAADALAMTTLATANGISGFSPTGPLTLSLTPSIDVLIGLGALAQLILLIPSVFAFITINRGFGKRSPWWTVFAVVIEPVWAALLGFRRSQYFRPELATGPRFWGAPTRRPAGR